MTCANPCDSCRLPGRCCTGFVLDQGTFGGHMHVLEVLVELATTWHAMDGQWPVRLRGSAPPAPHLQHVQVGLPFMPLGLSAAGAWRFWCPLLDRSGRCGDYENRPALCRAFAAGSDPLCIEYDAAAHQADQGEEKSDRAGDQEPQRAA